MPTAAEIKTATLTPADAVGPFTVYACVPRYCRHTDALIGSRTGRLNKNYYETFAGAVAAAWMASNEECYVSIRDAHGRDTDLARPAPPAPVCDPDDICF